MLALWSCGRRAGVVQAQRQIHRALRTAFAIAETVIRTIADQLALAVPRGHTSIGRHGSEHHSVRGFSSPLLQPTLQCSQLPVGVAAGSVTLPEIGAGPAGTNKAWLGRLQNAAGTSALVGRR